MKLAELQQLSTKELKELATKENVNATGDKRARITWLIALEEHFAQSPVPSPEPEPDDFPNLQSFESAWTDWQNTQSPLLSPQSPKPEEEPEPPTEHYPFPTKGAEGQRGRGAEEPFVPKFHEIYVTEAGIIRYRYKIESYKSEWIRWTGTKEELLVALQDIEESLEGTCTYKNHKIQVTPLLEINYKPPSGNWLKFPLEPDEDIQEGMSRLTNWIDKTAELTISDPLILTAVITETGMTEFRRNCVPIAAFPRPP